MNVILTGVSRTLLLCVLLLARASLAVGQKSSVEVRVRITDSSGKAIVGASVDLFRGLGARVASGATDTGGVAAVGAPRSEDLEIVVRRIGFQRRSVFFRSDSVDRRFDLTLQPAPVSLPAVDVTAARDVNRARYHVDADDIAQSSRPIADALDVVLKLRPDMAQPPNEGIFTRCGVFNLFVNGERVRYPPIDEALAAKARQERMAAMMAVWPGRPPHFTTQSRIPVSIQSALATIRPEHIEEMNYVNCSDTKSADVVRAQNGLFVVLKRGVAYEPGVGSYVVASDASAGEAAGIVQVSAVLNGSSTNFRSRIVGVFDEETGSPLVGAQVVDVKSATFATTTASGTVSLAFLAEGSNEIALRRPGYAELRLTVMISPADTVPLTLLMRPIKK
jgi:hypothetical protein